MYLSGCNQPRTNHMTHSGCDDVLEPKHQHEGWLRAQSKRERGPPARVRSEGGLFTTASADRPTPPNRYYPSVAIESHGGS